MLHYEHEVQLPNGEKAWQQWVDYAICNSQREVIEFLSVGRDVTERTQTEKALRDSEARTYAIVNTAVDGIITLNAEGIIESFNPSAEKIFGYTVGKVIGKNVKILMPQPYHDEHDDYITTYLQTGQRKIIGIGREAVGRRKDGTTFPLELEVSDVQLGDG